MKLKQLLSTLFVVSLFSCTKNNSGNNPNPPGGGGGGGGTSSNLTVTSITPANPYPDDEFIINGTGFNTNATLDTVEFGRMAGTNFGAWHDGLQTEWPSLCTVVSATATQLRVKSVNPFVLDYYSYSPSPLSSIAVAQVRTGGKKAVTPVIPFKRFMMLGFINNPDNSSSMGRPNDSLEISGRGFRKTGLTASIDGIPLTSFKIDSVSVGNSKISLRLPKTFFGVENDETLTQTKTVIVTNPDGKSVQKDCLFYLSPRMKIYTMRAENPTYSLAGLTSSGGVINIIITGACLKNDAVLKVGAIGILTQTPFPVNNFPDNTTLPLTPGTLIPGSYQATIWRGNTLYGGCNFTVTP
jgi:hypothetical protein